MVCSLLFVATKAQDTYLGGHSTKSAILDIDDGYGAPLAPVLASNKVKKSIPALEEEIDGYGSPAAPVISSSQPVSAPVRPVSQPTYYRPPRQIYRKKKMFNILHYMPMMNLLMMVTKRKPKRHIMMPYQKNRPLRFRMPRLRFLPPRVPRLVITKKPAKAYKKPVKSGVKLEYSGWKPIGYDYTLPEIKSNQIDTEPEIITIDNAHRHPKKYQVPELPVGNYAPEPITAKPNYDSLASVASVYGNRPTYEYTEKIATIEEPLFESAPVQDLTSLAKIEEQEESSPYHGSTAAFSIHVNGQSHGFSHNLNHQT